MVGRAPTVGNDVDEFDGAADEAASRRPFAAELDRVVAAIEERRAVAAEIELEAEPVDHHDRAVHAVEMREVAILQDAREADPPERPVAGWRNGDIPRRPAFMLDRNRLVILGGQADERTQLDRRPP